MSTTSGSIGDSGDGVRIGTTSIREELERLISLSLDLQDRINVLDLQDSDTNTRKAFQSADTLTQSLQCMNLLVASISDPINTGSEVEFSVDLGGIFLGEMRNRLLGLPEIEQDVSSGAVDFF